MLVRIWRKRGSCRNSTFLVGRNVNRCSHCEKHYGTFSKTFSKKQILELLYDPGIPLPCISPRKPPNTNLKIYMHLNVHSSIIKKLLKYRSSLNAHQQMNKDVKCICI